MGLFEELPTPKAKSHPYVVDPARTVPSDTANGIYAPEPYDTNVLHRSHVSGVKQGPPTDKEVVQRREAAKELARDFEIVPSNFVGPRLPNQVTADEMHQIVLLYDSIRRQTGDFIIDGDELDPMRADAWREDMLREVRALLQTSNGRDLLLRLNDNVIGDDKNTGEEIRRRTTVKPMFADANGDHKQDGKDAGYYNALDYENAVTSDEGDWKDPILRMDGTPGPGCDQLIRMNGGAYVLSGAYSDPFERPGATGMTLMHEGKHAYDSTRGRDNLRYIDPSDGVPWDVGILEREHEAVGLGRHRNDRMTENAWRAEQELIKAAGRFSEANDGVTTPRPHHHHRKGPQTPGEAIDGESMRGIRTRVQSNYVDNRLARPSFETIDLEALRAAVMGNYAK